MVERCKKAACAGDLNSIGPVLSWYQALDITDVCSQLSNAGLERGDAALVLTVPISFVLVVQSKNVDGPPTVGGM